MIKDHLTRTSMPDARSNAEQAAFVAGMLEAASLCGLEYVSEDETNGFLCDEDQSHNVGVANCVDAIRAGAAKSVPEGYRVVPVSDLQEIHDAMQAFTDPEDEMPEDTGEFRDLHKALVKCRAMLVAVKP